MILHQEADELAYRVAFGCEKQAYKVHNKHTGLCDDYENLFTKTEIINLQKEDGLLLEEDYTIEGYKIIDDETKAGMNLDSYIQSLFEVEIKENNLVKTVDEVKLWLSPSNHSNFRYKIAEIPGSRGTGYKAGRGEKPVYLQFIRDLLINDYKAIEIQGYEADDALGIHSGNDVILSHIDKDINMIPGWHYNHVKIETYYIDDQKWFIKLDDKKKPICNATMNFYFQLLTGDSTDNIPGIAGLGPVKACQLLQNCKDERECFEIVREKYIEYYSLQYADEALAECASLLWIVRSEGEIGELYLKNKGFLK